MTAALSARNLRRHRRLIGSRWRKLSCTRQALVLVLVLLRCGDPYSRLADTLDTARGERYVVLDGTPMAVGRVGMRTGSTNRGKHIGTG